MRREFGLKDLEVINDQTLALDGKQVGMNRDAFKGLCKIVGLPTGFDKTFSSAFGDKARQQLVNRLKIAAQAKGNTSVSVVLNPDTKRIIAVQKDPRDLISNQKTNDEFNRIVLEAESKKNNATSSLIYRDENLARKLLLEAKETAASLKPNSSSQKKYLDKLSAEIEEQLKNMIDGVGR